MYFKLDKMLKHQFVCFNTPLLFLFHTNKVK